MLPFDRLIAHLTDALRGPLPGAAAHALMSPRPRGEWPSGSIPPRTRAAAGLLLLFPLDDQAHIVLTVRGQRLDRHRGQVAMPGGAVEPDETFEEAALREAEEEIALTRDGVRIAGPLTPIDVPISGFRLHPIVASLDRRPVLRPADGEVARILDVPLADLLDPARVVWRTLTRARQFDYPAFPIDDVEIWGATAMVLGELLTLLGWPGPPPR